MPSRKGATRQHRSWVAVGGLLALIEVMVSNGTSRRAIVQQLVEQARVLDMTGHHEAANELLFLVDSISIDGAEVDQTATAPHR